VEKKYLIQGSTAVLTIQIPQDLEEQLAQRATQLNLSLETFIIQALQEVAQHSDIIDTPKAEVLAGFQRSLEDVKAGRVSSIETL
jgi:predicted transcriptional regulator